MSTSVHSKPLCDPTDRFAARLPRTVVIYVFIVSAMWAFITPMGGTPDEPSHITYSAAVVRGDLGHYQLVEHPQFDQLAVVSVPAWIATITESNTDPARSTTTWSYPCYRFNHDKPASCLTGVSGSVERVPIPTTVTRYPPPYYFLTGLPTLVSSGETAVYGMRLVSALIVTLLIGLGLRAASAPSRPWLALGIVVVFTPMSAHIAGSVNPSAMEIAAATGLGLALLGFERSHTTSRSVGTIIFLAFALAWARPLSFLTLLAVLAMSAAVRRRALFDGLFGGRFGSVAAIGTALAAVTAYGYRRFWVSIPRVATPAEASTPSVTSDTLTEVMADYSRRLVEFSVDLVGKLGWVDHQPPGTVLAVWSLLILATISGALVLGSQRDRMAIAGITVSALWVAPVVVAFRVFGTTSIYQARYHLPLAGVVVLGSLAVLWPHLGTERLKGTASAIALLPIAMLLAQAGSLYRYSLGGQPQLADLPNLAFGLSKWWPPLPGLAFVALGGLSLLVGLGFSYRILRPSQVEAT